MAESSRRWKIAYDYAFAQASHREPTAGLPSGLRLKRGVDPEEVASAYAMLRQMNVVAAGSFWSWARASGFAYVRKGMPDVAPGPKDWLTTMSAKNGGQTV